MPAPSVIITVSEALVRRGTPTDTGPLFLVFAGGTGITTPVKVITGSQVVATWGETTPITALAAQVSQALTEGAPSVTLVKADATGGGGIPDWAAALDKFIDPLGPGQVAIPGVFTPEAHQALMDHAGAHSGRVVLLDADPEATAAELVTLATSYANSEGAERATLIANSVTLPAPAGTLRTIPGSVLAAGLAARGDSRVGHANHAPIFTHSGGAGQLKVQPDTSSLTTTFSQSELDVLYDAGVCAFQIVNGVPLLGGWVSFRQGGSYSQLNVGRLLAGITAGTRENLSQYLGRQIDGRGLLYAEVEGSLRAYFLTLYSADALYGATADQGFDVSVAGVNTPADAAAGLLRAAVSITPTRYAATITLSIVVHTPGA